jgi:dGTPase
MSRSISAAEVAEIRAEVDARLSGENHQLSRYATPNDSEQACRLEPIEEAGEFVRAGIARVYDRDLCPFERDVDRINFYATRELPYKTMVYAAPSQHILHRMPVATRLSHSMDLGRVVFKAARGLGLNMDLVLAQALSHDIGHCPFGHLGEKILSKIAEENGLGKFHHSSQSLRIVDDLLKLNLTYAARNGLLFHDGEADEQAIYPNLEANEQTIQDFLKARMTIDPKVGREELAKSEGVNKDSPFRPSTMEGCVTRFCDSISYVGSDFEDAVTVGMIDRHWLPFDVRQGLGSTNSQIIDTLFNDLVLHSYDQPYLSFGDRGIALLRALKNFNREKIYFIENDIIKGKEMGDPRYDANPVLTRIKGLELKMRKMYKKLLKDLREGDKDSYVYDFVRDMTQESDEYIDVNSKEQVVLDCIAGMTDHQFMKVLEYVEKSERLI